MHEPRRDDPLVPERWRSLRVESLDGGQWGEPSPGATGLVQRCHEHRRVKLGELTPTQARVLLGQDIATRWVLPRAIELLLVDPMLEADCFEGDLLETACKRMVGGAELHRAAVEAMHRLVEEATARVAGADFDTTKTRRLLEATRQYLALNHPSSLGGR